MIFMVGKGKNLVKGES